MICSWFTFQSHLVSSVSHLFQWNKHPPLGNFTTVENALKMLRFGMDCTHCVHLWKYGCGHSCLRSNLVLGSGWPQENTEDRALSQILVALRKERLLNFSDKNECAQAPEVGEFRPLCLPSLLAAKKIKGEKKDWFWAHGELNEMVHSPPKELETCPHTSVNIKKKSSVQGKGFRPLRKVKLWLGHRHVGLYKSLLKFLPVHSAFFTGIS